MNIGERAEQWLKRSAIPLWSREGIDLNHAFYESLSFRGVPNRQENRRAMVQARQLYSFRNAMTFAPEHRDSLREIIRRGTQAMIRSYAQPTGEFAHTCDSNGRIVRTTPELYSQAFALFGLAQGYAIEPSVQLKETAIRLLNYLKRERRLSGGGYSEIDTQGTILYQSNPHMHLFEAGLAWMEFDSDPQWSAFTTEILDLCLSRFIQPGLGLLAEHFDSNWSPVRQEARFFFEPGHHFEWAWLMGRYQKMTGRDLVRIRRVLMNQAELHGVDSLRKAAWDQVWSDLSPKLRSSRFWPQCERVKAYSLAGSDGTLPYTTSRTKANEALETLFRYFETAVPGLWTDTWATDGTFQGSTAKASSFYHIIGAISEHTKMALPSSL